MTTLLLQSKSKKDIEIFAALAEKVGLKASYINEEDLEDMGLAKAMKQGRTGTYVNTDKSLKN